MAGLPHPASSPSSSAPTSFLPRRRSLRLILLLCGATLLLALGVLRRDGGSGGGGGMRVVEPGSLAELWDGVSEGRWRDGGAGEKVKGKEGLVQSPQPLQTDVVPAPAPPPTEEDEEAAHRDAEVEVVTGVLQPTEVKSEVLAAATSAAVVPAETAKEGEKSKGGDKGKGEEAGDSKEKEKDEKKKDGKKEKGGKEASKSSPSPSPSSSPSSSDSKKPRADIGKVTVSFGGPDEAYDAAIRSHARHNEIWGYPQFILTEQVVSGLWSKHAYLLQILVQELGKPEEERLKWLFWHDRDTVIMNPQLPLGIFLPPSPQFDQINLLVSNDHNGLNNGVFLLRVCEWSVKLFGYAYSFHHYNPDVPLKYSEQSAMEEVLKEPYFAHSTLTVPQRWFNAYPPPVIPHPPLTNQTTSTDVNRRKLSPHQARPGSLLIHFASNRDGLRPLRMLTWINKTAERSPEWERPVAETGYRREIDEWWRMLADGAEALDDVRDRVEYMASWDEVEALRAGKKTPAGRKGSKAGKIGGRGVWRA